MTMINTDIIIFGGQSNMQGQTECLSECDIVENAYEYKFLSDTAVLLKNPVGENIRYDGTQGDPITPECDLGKWLKEHVLGAACYGHTNLVPEFCRAYIKETSSKVLAVHAAKGSTQISDWLPGTDGYRFVAEKTLSAVKKAKEEGEVGDIFFVWLQGESDAVYSKSKEYYKEKLVSLSKSLKDDLNINKFGIIRVGRFMKDERDLEIISAQDEICLENEDFIMLTDIATQLNEIPKYMNPQIGGHYSAAGLEKLGSVAGETLGKYKKKTG